MNRSTSGDPATKVAILSRSGAVNVGELPTPEPGPGQVLFRLLRIGLRAERGESKVAAHGVAGEVLRLGLGVQDIIPGERYAVQSIVGCGECDFCFRARENLCPRAYHIHGFGEAGAYAEEFIVPAEAISQGCLIPLPDGMDADSGLFIEPLAFSMNAMNHLPISNTTHLVVIGAGIPGILCATIGRYRKARRVTVLDPDARRIESVRPLALPFDALLAGGDEAVAKVLAESPGGVDAVVVTIPDGVAVRRAVTLSAIGGHISLLVPAEVSAGAATIDPVVIARRELHIHGACGANRADYMEARHLVAEGYVPAAQLISHRYSIGELKSAMEVLSDPSASPREVILEIPATLSPPLAAFSTIPSAVEGPLISRGSREATSKEDTSREDEALSLYLGGVPMSDGEVAEMARRVREPEFHYGPGSDVGPSGQISPWPDLPEEYLREKEAERQRRLQRDRGRGRDRRERRGRGRGEVSRERFAAPGGDGRRSTPAGGHARERGIGREQAGRADSVRGPGGYGTDGRDTGGGGEPGRRESGRRGRGRRGRGREREPAEDRFYPEGGPLPEAPGPEFDELLAPEEAFTFEMPSPPIPFDGPALGRGSIEGDSAEDDLTEGKVLDLPPDDAGHVREPGEDREEEPPVRDVPPGEPPSAEDFLFSDLGHSAAAPPRDEERLHEGSPPPEIAAPIDEVENASREKRGKTGGPSGGRRSGGKPRTGGRGGGGDRRQSQRGGRRSDEQSSQGPAERAPRGPARKPEGRKENPRNRRGGQDRRGEARGEQGRRGVEQGRSGGGRSQGGRGLSAASSQPAQSSPPPPSEPRREEKNAPPPEPPPARPSQSDSLSSWPDYWGD